MSSAALALDDRVDEAPPDVRARPNVDQFVTFNVGNNAYGIDIMAVREIRSWSPVTELPDQAPGARGVLDIRGKIVEVFDLSRTLGSDEREARDDQVVLVVAIDGCDTGLAVDSVSDIVDASDGDFAEPPPTSRKISTIVRQDDHLISILDLNALFS